MALVLKKHLCGMAVVYDGHEEIGEGQPSLTVYPSRPNGSLYSRQKRSIADACEWMRLNQTKDRKALIFVLTSPGFTSVANTPKFISAFVENMKANYGMTDYVWVREMTKRGYPHFHFVALWHPYKWFLELRSDRPGEQYRMIHKISLYWSSLFGSNALNSVRLGSYKGKKRTTFYLTTDRHAWYLTKYLGKSIGDDSNGYLCEAGFPQTKYKKAVRSFGMSKQVALLSEPDLFEADWVVSGVRDVVKDLDGSIYRLESFKRVWKASEVDLTKYKGVNEIVNPDELLKAYKWNWTGNGNTWLGFEVNRAKWHRASPTSDKGQ